MASPRFRKATQCLQLAFGLDMKEVDHREHIYVMVPILGLTLNEMLCSAITSFLRPLPSAPRVSLDHGGRGRDLSMRAAVMLLWDL